MHDADKNDDHIFVINKLLYVIAAVAIIVVSYDLFVWRP